MNQHRQSRKGLFIQWGKGTTGENNQGQGRQQDRGDAHQNRNTISNERKGRRDLKNKRKHKTATAQFNMELLLLFVKVSNLPCLSLEVTSESGTNIDKIIIEIFNNMI